MSKKGHGAAADQAYQAFEAGCAIVRHHPLLGPLFRACTVLRDERYPLAADAWATVDRRGVIVAHPSRRGTPDEWAYVLAHLALHLGFGHFDPAAREGTEWNAACCAYVARFLGSLKLGRAPADVDGSPAIANRSEDALYAAMLEEGIPAALHSVGVAGSRRDMVADVAHRVWHSRGERWQDLLAHGLTQAVEAAIERAAGDGARPLGDERLSAAARRARDWVVSSYPLLGGLAAGFTYLEDPALCQTLDVSIAAVSPEAREIYLNPAAGLSEHELRFVIAHELLHAGLRHDARRQGRDPYLWNVACDYVINAWLVQMGVGVMPAVGALHDPELANESAESLYDRITGDLRTYRKLATFAGRGLGDILDPRPGWWARGEGLELDEFYRRALAQGLAYHEARGRGLVPAGLVEEIRALDMRPIPWDVALARWFELFFPPLERRRTFARPSRRQAAVPDVPLARWVAPSEEALAARTFGVLLDTSGSMDRTTLARALGAIAAYALAREVPAARVVFCDAAPYDQGYMPPEAILDRVRVRGRGGTVLQPGVDLLERAPDFPKDGPLLIITDGACDRLSVRREHAYLLPGGASLPFPPRGPVFRIEGPRA